MSKLSTRNQEMQAPLLSAIMIVKNEEKNLPRCLASLKNVVDEIVIVDTGSEDKTVEIAKSAGAIIHFFPWNGIECDARNISVRAATGRWLFMIDADEEVGASLAKELHPAIERLDADASYNSVSLIWRNHYLSNNTSLTRLLRIGRNRPDYAFSGSIHPTCNYHFKTWALNGHLEHYGYQWTKEHRVRKAAHMMQHLSPLCIGEKPPLKSLSELLTVLLIAEEPEQFEIRWQQVQQYSKQERLYGPHAAYWFDNIANVLQSFSTKEDWEKGFVFAEEILEVQPKHVAALFYLLQIAVKDKNWPKVEAYASKVLGIDPNMPEFYTILFPEKQLLPSKGWLWLALVEQGKTDSSFIPVELETSRLVPVLLSAQIKNRAPIKSSSLSLNKALQLIWLIQHGENLDPLRRLNLLAKLSQFQQQHEIKTITYMILSLGKCALLQQEQRAKEIREQMEILMENYSDYYWLTSGIKKVAVGQKFELEIFYRENLHHC